MAVKKGTRKKGTHYDRNADKILSKRKKLYDSDPEYRKTIIQRTVESARKRRQKARELKLANKLDRKIWSNFQMPNGSVKKCCRVGHLANLLGRSAQTIKLWERDGFPMTFRKANQRYYTQENVNMILSQFKKHENVHKFISEVQKNWQSYN